MILVVGESLMDMLPRESGGRGCFLPIPGGSPFNVSVALGRLGVPVRFLCPLSRDPFGELLRHVLLASRVDVSLCPLTTALTTLGFVTPEASSGTSNYAFYTAGTAGCALAPGHLPEQLPASTRCLHIGSFSLAVEPFGSASEKLLNDHANGRVVSLDPNIRPFLIPDKASFVQRLDRILLRTHLVKLSAEDAEWLRPGVSFDVLAGDYLDRGARLVVFTLGAGGSLAFTREEQVSVAAPPVHLADTVGAGDTFHAAMLCWLVRNHLLTPEKIGSLSGGQLQSLLGFAAAAAAITCSRPGCDPPWDRELAASTSDDSMQ